MPDSGNFLHNLSVSAYPTFPQLSRKPALKTRTAIMDPTLRDSMDNGMETTRAKFTRQRRTWSIAMDLLTPTDVDKLEKFITITVNYGALPFFFPDPRDPRNPKNYLVRFSVLPVFTDAGWIQGIYRQNATFEIREM